MAEQLIILDPTEEGRSRKGTFRPYWTPEPQPRGAVTRRAVAQSG